MEDDPDLLAFTLTDERPQPAGYMPPEGVEHEDGPEGGAGKGEGGKRKPVYALNQEQTQALSGVRGLVAKLRDAGLDEDDALVLARARRERLRVASRPPEAALGDAVAAVFRIDPRRPLGELATAIPNRPLRFLWKPRLPQGMVLLSGDTGAAKSLTAAYLVARHTTGTPFPLEPKNVRRKPATALVLVDGEESATSFREKVEAAGGDPKRLYIIDVAERAHRAPELPQDAERLATYMQGVGATFCVADGVFSFLEDDVDIMSNASLRKALVRVNYVMRNKGLCFLGLRWVSKSASGYNAAAAGMGATSGTGVVRSELYVGTLDKATSRRVLAPVKTSFEALGATASLEFEIRATRSGVPFLHFVKKSELTADEVFAGTRNRSQQAANTKKAKGAAAADAILAALHAQPEGIAVLPSPLHPGEPSVMGLLMEYEVVDPESKDPLNTQAYRKIGERLLKDKAIMKEQRKTGALTKSGKPERAWFWKLSVNDERSDGPNKGEVE
jgi:hypothetical protein